MINHVPQHTADSMETLVQLLRVLSDPTRLRLLEALRDGEKNVTALCRSLDLAQPTVSHHLALLRSAGMVRPRRDGKQIFYSLHDGAVECHDSAMSFSTGSHELRVAPNGRRHAAPEPERAQSVAGSTLPDELTRQSA